MWKKRKQERGGKAPDWLVKLAERGYYFKRRVSDWLQARAGRVSSARLRWYCLLFVLGGSLVNTWILVQALDDQETKLDFKSVKTSLPAGIVHPKRVVDQMSFQSYMDSIEADARLKGTFDSLLVARPDFAEAIRQLEELYPRGR